MSINRWEDPNDLAKKIKKLSEGLPWEVEKEFYETKVCSYFDINCTASKLEAESANKILPGGHEREGYINSPFPLIFKKTVEGTIDDIDGNKYINFHKSNGETILGANNKKVAKAVKEGIEEYGIGMNLPTNEERLLAEKIQENMPSIEMIKFFSTRTEAAMAAVKLARTFTKRKKIIKVGGANHGWYDDLLVGNRIQGSGMFLDTFGVNRAAVKFTKEIKANDLKSAKKAISKKVAAVIVEPIGGADGGLPIDYFYCKQLKELCLKKGVLLIFDESVTAFRLGNGGVQEYLNVSPDLTILGDVVGGGLPSSALGGKKKILNHFSKELSHKGRNTYVCSNQYGNPVIAKAGYTAINEIISKDVCQRTSDLADKLADELNSIIYRENLPFVVYNQGSIVHLEIVGALKFDVSSRSKVGTLIKLKKIKKEFLKKKIILERLNATYLCAGLVLSDGTKMYINADMTIELINEAVKEFEKVLKRINKSDITQDEKEKRVEKKPKERKSEIKKEKGKPDEPKAKKEKKSKLTVVDPKRKGVEERESNFSIPATTTLEIIGMIDSIEEEKKKTNESDLKKSDSKDEK